MHKPSKTKKDKVPKLTEEEYAAYIASLKEQNHQKETEPPSMLKKAGIPQN